MEIRRVVPDIRVADLAVAKDFYVGLFGLEVGMETEWMVNLGSASNSTAQLQLFRDDSTGPPVASLEVRDVDAVHATALRRGCRIVRPLTDEPWGVRRFFVADPDGNVVNVMMHLD